MGNTVLHLNIHKKTQNQQPPFSKEFNSIILAVIMTHSPAEETEQQHIILDTAL